jgi:Tfp pilus assembly protein PilV
MNRSRRGSMFLEVCMATLVASVAFVVSAQILVIVARQQRALEQRQGATRQAANLLERVMAQPWESLTPEQLNSLAQSSDAVRQLPGGKAQIDVIDHDQPAAREIRLRVGWVNRAGQPERPVQLVAWRYRSEGTTAP